MKEIKLLELFSGIGGFAKGLEEAGFDITKHYFSEIDRHAIANYKYNFKNAEYIGSVTDVRGAELERPNIITFGSPCQDFSLAGNRLGMDGERSSLILHAIRLITECRPDVFIWENVKGTFSSNDGADFWGIIKAFANIGGYRLEWQLLNTAWFLPQNRERIYLIGHSSERSECGVFPIGKTVKLYSETNKEKSNKGEKGEVEQQLEPRFDGLTNTLTSVTKDNLVQIGDLRGDEGFRWRENGNAPTLKANSDGKDIYNAALLKNNSVIRRLTEIECERLQGFPDNWTELGDYNGVVKKIPKTQRYKLCGNAVTVEVVRQIGIRLKIKAA